MTLKTEEVLKKMMKAAISKRVKDDLTEAARGYKQFTEDLTREEQKIVAALVMDWIKEAAAEFDAESRTALSKIK